MRRVLLVPDRVIVGELGPSYLDRGSLSVRSALDAAEGLRMAAAYRPDLVVFHDDLPGISTAEFCRAIRQVLPKVKLLMITELLGQAAAFDDWCDGQLVQPVNAEQLLETAADLLEIRTRRGPRVPLEALVHVEGFGLTTPDGTCVANAINVSENGILLESSEHLALGEQGTVLFFLPDDSERVCVAGRARVATDEVRLHYAIEFVGMDEPSRSSIARYVETQREP